MNQGFGNFFSSEAEQGAIPLTQNCPHQLKHHLYAEQLNGSAFTRQRHQNLKTWLYRLEPSVIHHKLPYQLCQHQWIQTLANPLPPEPMRWSALQKKSKQNFIESMTHIASSGHSKHFYILNLSQSMEHEYFVNQDGDLLFIPYQGKVKIHTELGPLEIKPEHIAVIPRGIGFKLELLSNSLEAYVCENQGKPFRLPELGIMGANGLANPRHFIYPNAHYEPHIQPAKLICKYQNTLWEKTIKRSILDVVGWQGNYAPYQYDLNLFNTINTVSFDHPDPSIFTVLTSDSDSPGIANLDFVIFPKRWMVAEHTMRLPYFHKNVMSELMGLIKGQYDAKGKDFEVGGWSIHNQLCAHGPDYDSYAKELNRTDKPVFINDSLAFMLETNEPWIPTNRILQNPAFQKNYGNCWQGFPIAMIQK